ncbi:peptidase inhibitor family I36 protein [Streptomyces sp. NBC_01422]|uniref:peptidase inhibitor family I36 protein n=1 Tax=Streptomyces sp. NBC_01422 TaxID=2903859 RepID=UPI002E2CCAB5|nr:peptidase inhibitor family I36 protein [Streptomyces sp. NBC_01422]
MKRASFKLASAIAAGMVAGASLLFSAGSAVAANSAYDGCPGWALCLYQHQGGTGSKAVINPADGWVKLYKVHFLNGELANNQTTSWLNNSTCSVSFWDNPDEPYTAQLDWVEKNKYGSKNDWSGTSSNDRLGGVQFDCP